MPERRVAITGIGPVSAIGTGREAFFDAVKHRRSGVAEITLFDAEPYRCQHAAEITDFNVEPYLETPKAYLDRTAELVFAAASLALRDASIAVADLDPRRTGVVFASAYGSLDTMATFFDDVLKKGARSAKPFLFPHTYANAPVSLLAIELGLTGHHLHFACGATGSAVTLLEAFDCVRSGRADRVIAGGYEAFSEVLHAGLDRAALLGASRNGSPPAPPCDPARSGFVPGEGSIAFVVEDLASARARGAAPCAEIAAACILAGQPRGDAGHCSARIAQAMREATTGLLPDYVAAAANGSVVMDAMEQRAIAEFLGDRAPGVAVDAPAELLGECLGAGGGLRVAAALAAMANSRAIESAVINTLDASGGIVSIGLTRIH